MPSSPPPLDNVNNPITEKEKSPLEENDDDDDDRIDDGNDSVMDASEAIALLEAAPSSAAAEEGVNTTDANVEAIITDTATTRLCDNVIDTNENGITENNIQETACNDDNNDNATSYPVKDDVTKNDQNGSSNDDQEESKKKDDKESSKKDNDDDPGKNSDTNDHENAKSDENPIIMYTFQDNTSIDAAVMEEGDTIDVKIVQDENSNNFVTAFEKEQDVNQSNNDGDNEDKDVLNASKIDHDDGATKKDQEDDNDNMPLPSNQKTDDITQAFNDADGGGEDKVVKEEDSINVEASVTNNSNHTENDNTDNIAEKEKQSNMSPSSSYSDTQESQTKKATATNSSRTYKRKKKTPKRQRSLLSSKTPASTDDDASSNEEEDDDNNNDSTYRLSNKNQQSGTRTRRRRSSRIRDATPKKKNTKISKTTMTKKSKKRSRSNSHSDNGHNDNDDDDDDDDDEPITVMIAKNSKKHKPSPTEPPPSWDEMVSALKIFIQKHKHSNVPKSYKKHAFLHQWVQDQKDGYWSRKEEMKRKMRESWRIRKEREQKKKEDEKQEEEMGEKKKKEKDDGVVSSTAMDVEVTPLNFSEEVSEERSTKEAMQNAEEGEDKEGDGEMMEGDDSSTWEEMPKKNSSSPIKSKTTTVPPTITPKRIKILKELNFDWGTEPTTTTSNTSSSSSRKRSRSNENENYITKNSKREMALEETNDAKWHTSYKELKAYYKENGHCDVPRSYDNKTLCFWVVRQRMLYKRWREEQEKEKEEMTTSSSSSSTTTSSGQKKRRSTTRTGKSTSGENNTSSSPASSKNSDQRGLITENRIRLLNEINFTWHMPDRHWTDRYNELLAYKKEHGDCNVPYENGSLGHWVSKQRKNYQLLKKRDSQQQQNDERKSPEEDGGLDDEEHDKEKGKGATTTAATETFSLTKERADKLKEIGFDFEPRRLERDVHWLTLFDELKKYKDEHGDLSVPSKKSAGYSALYQWILRQRLEFKKLLKGESSPLSNGTRIRDLDDIGFDFIPAKRNASTKQVKEEEEGAAALVPQAEDDDEGFERKLGKLFVHNAKYGDCNVHKEGSQNLELIPWVEDLRVQFNRYRKKEKTYLTDKRVEILTKLGFEWAFLKEGRAPWSVRIAQLKEYKDEHGNMMVPSDYLPNPSLGRWVNSTRLIYWKIMDGEDLERLEKKLSPERIAELDELGFVWKIRGSEKDWDKMFDELKEYKEEHGDCYVSRNTDPKYDALRKWLPSVRGLKYRLKNNSRRCNMQLTEDRIKRLTDLGYEWPKERPSLPRVGWDARFEELRQYREQHGNARVPRYYEPVPSLGTWCATQRSEYRKFKDGKKSATLNEERIAALESLGFEFSITGSRVSWDTRYEELKKFKEEFGDCCVPIRFNANRKLGSWVTKQRNEYRQLREGKKTNMTEERMRKLQEIGFIWVDQHGGAKTNWEKKYYELRQYKAEFEDCLVPEDYQRNPRLGTWVVQQRTNYQLFNEGKPSDMTEDQISRLNRLGFSWVPKTSFLQYFGYLLHYREEFGNVNVPREYPANPPLGNWVADLRAQYKLKKSGMPSKITDKQIKKLEDLGFLWKSVPRRKKVPIVPWEHRYEELKRYKEENGNCNIPQTHPSLGPWMRSQKEQYRKMQAGKQSSLTEEKVRVMTELGVQWESRPRAVNDWNEMLERLRQYKEETGHTKVPRNFPQDQQLANWVATQRTEYNKFKRGKTTIMTEERCAALEELDFAFTIRGAKVTWDHRYEQICQYKEEFGDCLVPFRFNANPKLGSWVTTQRNQYRLMQEGKHTHMTEERVQKLNAIGFTWVDQQGGAKTNWEKKYHELRQYKAEFGDCLVPDNYKRNARLGAWVVQQRKNYQLLSEGHQSDLTSDQIERLDRIGFDWGASVVTHDYSAEIHHQPVLTHEYPKPSNEGTDMQAMLPPMVDFRNLRTENDRGAYQYDMDLQILPQV